MAMVYLTITMTMIPLGFVIFIWGLDKGNNTNTFAGAIIIALAIVMWIGSMQIAKREHNEETKRQERIIAILEDIATKMGADVNMSKLEPQPPLTKKRFMRLLTKSAQPVKPDSKEIGTSESHPSDGCSEKDKSQDTLEDKED